ncbi:hypothetical protein [Streptomyces carminius]|uniref:hypothetical protein n=1 Tax=Streptomyces carminius TaxID=2665496 RepID=UPI0013044103|nr:hypothetical protein [Streptomyces carminius]
MHMEALDVSPPSAAGWLTRNTDNRPLGKGAGREPRGAEPVHPCGGSGTCVDNLKCE